MKHPSGSHLKSRATSVGTTNQLRIIGGQWRGRKLSFPSVEGLRPTGDRIRETLFNWLAPHLHSARCLDLFAGSGALGLEALSRGALTSVLVERDNAAVQHLRTNLALLQADHGQVLHTDVVNLLRQGNPGEGFDVVFVDPPFQQDLWQAVIDALESGGWLAKEAAVYIESGHTAAYDVPHGWHLHRDKQAGQVCYRLFYRVSADAASN